MFFAGERPDELPEHRLESVLGLLRRELRHGRLLADHQLQFGDQVYHELAIGTQRFEDSILPMNDLLLAHNEDLTHQRLESLRQRRIRYGPFILIEFPRNKDAARQNDHLMQLMDDGGFADSRVTGYKHQFRSAGSHHSMKGI